MATEQELVQNKILTVATQVWCGIREFKKDFFKTSLREGKVIIEVDLWEKYSDYIIKELYNRHIEFADCGRTYKALTW